MKEEGRLCWQSKNSNLEDIWRLSFSHSLVWIKKYFKNVDGDTFFGKYYQLSTFNFWFKCDFGSICESQAIGKNRLPYHWPHQTKDGSTRSHFQGRQNHMAFPNHFGCYDLENERTILEDVTFLFDNLSLSSNKNSCNRFIHSLQPVCF